MKVIIFEMPSGATFPEEEVSQIQQEIIAILCRHNLLVSDAKEILNMTAEKIDRTAKLQAPPQ